MRRPSTTLESQHRPSWENRRGHGDEDSALFLREPLQLGFKETISRDKRHTKAQNTQRSHKIYGGKWTITSNYHKLHEQICVSASLLRHNHRENKLFSLSN